jgi:hypothetical protein
MYIIPQNEIDGFGGGGDMMMMMMMIFSSYLGLVLLSDLYPRLPTKMLYVFPATY